MLGCPYVSAHGLCCRCSVSGSGQEKYIRVFVAAVEVRPSAPSTFIYTVSATGTAVGWSNLPSLSDTLHP